MVDANEPLVEYPILFPLKVVGLNEPDFQTFVVEIVRRHVPELVEENVLIHFSTSGKYCSVSFQFIAQSRSQMDALYNELSSHKRVVMIL